jgi:nucleotide-binding universal stress UspA family protein
MDERLVTNASRALAQVLDLRKDEVFLVVTDEVTREVGEAFRQAAEGMGAKPTLYVLPEASRPLKELPEDLAALIPDADVAVTCFKGFAAETPFRIELIRSLTRVVRRLGHGPGITTRMLAEGPMSVDYRKLAIDAHALMRRFNGAATVHVTAPGGTDVTLDIADRPFATDAEILDGKWGNLPAGEIWCAPVEDAANGVIVCDGSIGDLGAVPAPVSLVVSAGRVTAVDCDDPAFKARVKEALAVDDSARVIGELGIGLNPGACLTGNLLEDEKAGRTAHIAFGNNEDMGGGRNRSKTHRDFLFREPTFDVTYADGRVERVIEAGVPVAVAPKAHPLGYRHVMVAIDFSEASAMALKVGDALARMSGASLTVCHVIHHATPVSPLFPHYASLPDPDLARREEEEAVERLDAMTADATGRGADEYEGVVARGTPAAELVRLARERGVDLMVVASLGHGRIERMLLGSVAESVARNAHCQVLVAR